MKLLLTIILLPAFILLSCKQSEDEPDQTHLENGQKTSQQENTDSSQQANKPDQNYTITIKGDWREFVHDVEFTVEGKDPLKFEARSFVSTCVLLKTSHFSKLTIIIRTSGDNQVQSNPITCSQANGCLPNIPGNYFLDIPVELVSNEVLLPQPSFTLSGEMFPELRYCKRL